MLSLLFEKRKKRKNGITNDKKGRSIIESYEFCNNLHRGVNSSQGLQPASFLGY